MKNVLALFFGFLGYLFLEGFTRLIIMFYHRDNFTFYGVENLPDSNWIIVIYLAVLINTWLVMMVVSSVINSNTKKYALIFGMMLILWRIFEILNSINTEPAWYLFTIPLVNLLGVFLAYKLYTIQNEKIISS